MTENSLFHLIYVSRNEIQGDQKDVLLEIEDILTTARENNAKKEITGALIFNDGCFAQVLEGPQEAIEDLFEDIQQDERHSHALVLSCEPIQTRSFSKWSMAYHGSDTQAKKTFGKIMEDKDFNSLNVSSNKIFSLISEHISEHEKSIQ
jgi:hypothetical protein